MPTKKKLTPVSPTSPEERRPTVNGEPTESPPVKSKKRKAEAEEVPAVVKRKGRGRQPVGLAVESIPEDSEATGRC